MIKTLLTACALLAGTGGRPCVEPGAAAPAPSPAGARAEKEWTVMVYVNAKNNLDKFGLKDVNEMEAAGSTDKVNIVAELGRKSGNSRYLVNKDSDPANITSPAVMPLGKADMGDYKHLAEFGRWAKANYPAKHYMLVVWNHGTGWVAKGPGAARGVSYDDETRHHITTPELAMALKDIGKVDVLGFDACLMQMAEVAYEIMPYTDYIIGSEQTTPGDGYPYDKVLAPLTANPGMTAEELGRGTVSAFVEYYNSIHEFGASMSLLRTDKLPELAELTAAWTAAVRTAGESAAVKTAKNNAQRYTNADNKDMSHFVQLASEGAQNAEVRQQGRALSDFIAGELVLAMGRVGGVGLATRGLTVYMPEGSFFDNDYDSLVWGKVSGWVSFARWAQAIR